MVQKIILTFYIILLLIQPSTSLQVFASPPGHRKAVKGGPAILASPFLIFLMGQVRGWLIGKALDYAYERTELKELFDGGEKRTRQLLGEPTLSSKDIATLKELNEKFARTSKIIADNNLPDNRARQQIIALFKNYKSLEARTNDLDVRLQRIEQEQNRQLRMIIENEEDVDAIKTQIERHSTRIDELEKVVYADKDRFKRPNFILGLGGLYSSSDKLQNGEAIGFDLNISYLLSSHVSIYAGYLYIPINATDIDNIEEGGVNSWNTDFGQLGLSFSLSKYTSPFHAQITVGAGIASSKLEYFPPGVDRSNSDNATELGRKANLAFTGRIDIGYGKTEWGFKPYISVFYNRFADDIVVANQNLLSNVGDRILSAAVGVRLSDHLFNNINKK